MRIGCAHSPTGSTGRKRPALVIGPEVDRADAWDAGVEFAEKVHAPVYGSPLTDRAGFPENHPLWQGLLPMTIAEVTEVLRGHDLVVVVGAQVFRYYPYVPGEYLPDGTELLHITNDPFLTGAAPVGDSLISDTLLALQQLTPLIEVTSDRPTPTPIDRSPATVEAASAPLTPDQVYSTLSTVKPPEAALVERVDVDVGRAATLAARHRTAFVLRHRQWRYRLGRTRRRRGRVG